MRYVKEFSTFLVIEELKSLGSLKSFLDIHLSYMWGCILCFSHSEFLLSTIGSDCSLMWLLKAIFFPSWVSQGSLACIDVIAAWLLLLMTETALVYWYVAEIFHFIHHHLVCCCGMIYVGRCSLECVLYVKHQSGLSAFSYHVCFWHQDFSKRRHLFKLLWESRVGRVHGK